jgi:hypothetical protein
VGSGAERATRIDDDGERVARRRLPRRADPEAAHANRPVEGAPLVLPATVDVRAARAGEERPETLLPCGVRVRGELDALGAVDLLEPLREQLEHGRASLFETLRPDLDGNAAETQRNALFSLSKNDSSVR